jgi:transposase
MLSQPDNRPSVVRRMTAGQMLLDGASDDEVADRLHISKHTVRRYRSIVAAGGIEALKALGVGGRVSVLDEAALAWLASALNDSARVYGFESAAWTNARLRALIERRFGVKFSRVYVWQLATKIGMGHILSKSKR